MKNISKRFDFTALENDFNANGHAQQRVCCSPGSSGRVVDTTAKVISHGEVNSMPMSMPAFVCQSSNFYNGELRAISSLPYSVNTASTSSGRQGHKTNTTWQWSNDYLKLEIAIYLLEHIYKELSDSSKCKICQSLGLPFPIRGRGLIKAAQSELNKNTETTVSHVAKTMGIKPEYIFYAYPVSGVGGEEALSAREDDLRFCRDLTPSEIRTEERTYSIYHREYQLNFADQIEQVTILYQASDGEEFVILATLNDAENCHREISSGKNAPKAYCFQRTVIDKKKGTPVILPMNTYLALHLRKLELEARLSDQDYILSGYVAENGNFDAVLLEDLRYRKVTLIPIFTKDGFEQAVLLAIRLKKYGCDVSIYPWPIFRRSAARAAAENSAGSPWKMTMAKRGTNLYEIEVISPLFKRILTDALSPEEFKILLFELGLRELQDEQEQKPQMQLPIYQIDDLEALQDEAISPDLSSLVTTDNTTFIWGGTHGGKTNVAFVIGAAISSGTGIFYFGAGQDPRKVLIVNGETSGIQMAAILKIAKQNNPHKDLLHKNFRHMPLRNEYISLLDPNVQSELIALIDAEQIKVIIFDNLITLAPNAVKGSAEELFKFFNKLESLGVSVIFVSHANKKGEAMGSSNLISKSQNVFKVEGNVQLKGEKGLSKAVEKALEEKISVLRLTCEKCKLPKELTGERATYKLTEDAGWEYMEGTPYIEALCIQEAADKDVTVEDAVISSTDEPIVVPVHDERLEELSEREREVLQCFQAGQPLGRKEIEEKVQLGKSTAGNVLTDLVNTGHLHKIGSGKNIKYSLPK